MAIVTCGLVLSSKSKPVMAKTHCELLGVGDRIWGFYDDNGTEGYSGRTQ
jgi:hypothetical protein